MTEDESGITMPLDADRASALVGRSLVGAGVRTRSHELAAATIVTDVERPVRGLGPEAPAVVLIGAFDGLHVGHRSLVAAARADAQVRGIPCVAVTFSPDPAEVLIGPQTSATLLDVDARARGLLSLGVDAVAIVPFTRQLAGTDERAFVEQVLLSVVRPAWVHVGSNFSFGRAGAGDVVALARLGHELGFGVTGHGLVELDGASVSATRIRDLLHAGRVERASRLLGRCHYVRGGIGHGRGQGTGFGFPTANVTMDPRTCMPEEGVFACYLVLDHTAWPAAVNVGAPPTFSAPEDNFLEANLIGFSGDIYGREAKVVFVRWLRASRRFDSTEELERVVLGNIDWVRDNLGTGGVEVAFDS